MALSAGAVTRIRAAAKAKGIDLSEADVRKSAGEEEAMPVTKTAEATEKTSLLDLIRKRKSNQEQAANEY